MDNIMESKLYKEFPRVYPQAYTMGFTYDDVKQMYDRILNNTKANYWYASHSHKETVLKMIMVRVGLDRDEFFQQLNELSKYDLPDNLLEKICGKYSLIAFKSLIPRKNNRGDDVYWY